MSCIKYSFFFFNFLFWVLGALSLGVGIWAATDDAFDTKVEDALSTVDGLDVSLVKQVINPQLKSHHKWLEPSRV